MLRQGQTTVEALEDRALLATFTVSSLADSGSGTLREAVDLANADAMNDTIVFAAALNGSIISLDSKLIVRGAVEITGPGADLLTLSGSDNSTIFSMEGSAFATSLSGVTIANSANGAGVDLRNDGGSVAIDGVVFENNRSVDGGGLRVERNSATVTNSAFIGNTTTFTGSALSVTDGDLTLRNVTISGNTGGSVIRNIANDGQQSILRILNSTITDNGSVNTVAAGSGTTETFIGNSIVSNSIGNNFFTDATSTLTSLGHNISNDASGSLSGPGDQNSTDPMLASLADNGGPTPTHALQPGSPAVDAGATIANHLVTPTSVTSSTSNDFAAASNLIGNTSISFDNYTTRNEFSFTDGWVTADPNGPSGDYFANGTAAPALTIELGSVKQLTDLILWGGAGINNNDIKDFTLEFSSDGGTTFSAPVSFNKPRTTSALRIFTLPLGDRYTADVIRLTATDNYFGEAGQSGGDRVAFNELRFLGLDEFDQRGPGFARVLDGNGDGTANVDIGAFEAPFVPPAEYMVTTDLDELDYSNAAVSLREAITSANFHEGHQEITFDASMSGQAILLESGDLLIDDGVTISGLGAGQTIIDAQQMSRVFDIASSAVDVMLDGLTIKNGLVTDSAERGGGGIRSHLTGTLTVENSTVTGNTVDIDLAFAHLTGGGIMSRDGSLTVINSTVSNNTVTGQGSNGGGIFMEAGDLNVVNSTISGNTLQGVCCSYGGGIASRNGNATVVNSTISGNSITVSGDFTGAYGGGIYAGGGNLTVSSSTISGNTLAASGQDSGAYGGGINHNSSGGGGGVLRLTNTIVAGNLGTNGAPSDISGTASGASANNLIGDASTAGGLTDGDANNNIVLQNADEWKTVLENDGTDPLLADNGGPTQTIALLVGTDTARDAVDAGDNDLALDAQGIPLTTDQRGTPFDRIVNATVDIGAYELQTLDPSAFIVTTLADELDYSNNTATSGVSLREAINSANGSVNGATPDEITFAPSLTSDGASTITLTLGELRITDGVTITGPGADLLTIDADGTSRIFTIDNRDDATAIEVNLFGLTLTGGRAADANGGGAIYSVENLTVSDSVVADNESETSGGGIQSGGNSSSATGTRLTVTNSTFSENAAIDGGGIYSFGATLSVLNSTFDGNNATNDENGDGGAIFNHDGDATVVQSTFVGNSATKGGGAIWHQEIGNVLITQSTFVKNIADSDANGSGAGGALNVILANTAPTAHNTIFAGNQVGIFEDEIWGPLDAASSHNLIGTTEVNRGGGLQDGEGGNIVGVDWKTVVENDGVDPTLRNNGGPTQTVALLPDGPAIDAGSNAAADAGLSTDQRGPGFDRVQDGDGDGNTVVDIGSFEFRRGLQTIAPDPVRQTVVPGSSAIIGVDYTASDDTLSGLLLRMHFDSTQLTFVETANVFQNNVSDVVVLNDVSDLDNDASTDTFLQVIWFDFAGTWPGERTLPLRLFDAEFTTATGLDQTFVNFTSDPPIGFDFQSTSAAVDALQLIVQQSAGDTVVSESRTTDDFSVSLSAEPASDVVINIANADDTEVAPAVVESLTFTPANWDQPQTVTVSGVDDLIVDGDTITILTLSIDADASDDAFDSILDQTVSVTNLDDDVAALSVTIIADSVSEAAGIAATTATVTRNTDTTNPLTVTLTSDDTGEATVPATVTIPAGQSSVTFDVDAVDDAIVDGTQTVTVTATAANHNDGTDSVDVTDDDVAALSVTIIADSVSEADGIGATTGTVTRNGDTIDPLTVTLTSDDTSEATLIATVTIPAGASTAAFDIDAIDDPILDGTQPVTITARATGYNDGSDMLDVTDDEVPGFTVVESDGSTVVSESGTRDTFTVVLNVQPLTPVVIKLNWQATDEAIVGPLTLTFAPDVWNAPQTVTVTGVPDGIVDGDQTAPVTMSINLDESDDGFDPVADQTVNVTILDLPDQPVTCLVDTEVDESDGDFRPGDCSLREAIELSNAAGGGGTIRFDTDWVNAQNRRTIVLTDQPGDVTGDLPTITASVTIEGPGLELLTVDGDRAWRIFDINDGDDDMRIDVVINGLTLRHGLARLDADDASEGSGGAIRSRENVTLRHVKMFRNAAQFDGGAIENAEAGSLIIEVSTSDENSAARGGGIINRGNLIVRRTTISNGTAQHGGGIYNTGTANVTSSTISANNASRGGGIDNTGTLRIDHSTITKNTSTTNPIRDLSDAGGGIRTSPDSTLVLVNAIVAGNVSGVLPIVQVDVAGPVVGDDSFNNLIGVDYGLTGITNGVNGNTIGVAETFNDEQSSLTPAQPIDPLLGPLQYNGGSAPHTHALLEGSPALDAGDGTNQGVPEIDQRGLTRLIDLPAFDNAVDGIDIGAVESLGGADQTALKLDIDGDASAQPLSDGILIVRQFAGFSGTTLTNNAANPEGVRSDATGIATWFATISAGLLDIDDDGQVLPLSDGILILRFMAGFTGEALVAGAVNPEGLRTDPDEILAHLQSMLPDDPAPGATPRASAAPSGRTATAPRRDTTGDTDDSMSSFETTEADLAVGPVATAASTAATANPARSAILNQSADNESVLTFRPLDQMFADVLESDLEFGV